MTSLHESLSLFLWARLVLTEYLNKESTSCWTKILGIRLTKRCSKTCYAPTKTCYIYFIIVCNNDVYYSITTNRFQICQNSSGFKSHNWFWISNSEMMSPTPSWSWCSSVRAQLYSSTIRGRQKTQHEVNLWLHSSICFF